MSRAILPSVCPLDCGDTCSFDVTVEDDRILAVRGSEANPLTAGSICAKVTQYPQWVHGEGRLTRPLRRVGPKGAGELVPVSWEEALDRVYEGFDRVRRRHGPQAILPLNYAGPHGMLAGGSMDLRFFHRLGASLLSRRPMCGGIKDTAFTGTYGSVPLMRPEHIAEARLIVVWGNNVTVSQLHLMPYIRAARRAGAKLVVVDPRRTPVADKADLHLAVNPGTDVVLAFALAAELERLGAIDEAFVSAQVLGAPEFLERARAWDAERAAAECGLPAEEIRRLARWYAEASPAVIVPGNGPERNRNGGSGLRAVFALPALAGKFGVRGGGLLAGASSAFPKTPARLQRPDLVPEGTRTINILDVGRLLLDPSLDPPIEALLIYNHNPVIVHPEQSTMLRALAQESLFTVACDVVMTDSCKYADIVLPACSSFEHDEIYGAYGQHYLQRAQPVIPPVGEALPNTEIFRRLAARFGFDEPAFRDSDAALMDAALDAADPRLDGRRPSELPLGEALAMRFDGRDAMLFDTTLPRTESGKIELRSARLEREYGQALPGYRRLESPYPLWLLSPSSDQRTTSTFGGLRRSDRAWLEIHPSDAQARGLADGDTARVWNDLGEVFLEVQLSDRLRPGVLCSYKGAWLRTSTNGRTVSVLAPADHADLCEGACYNDTRVEVALAPG